MISTQAKINKLKSLGYTGTVDEMFLAWLKARGATSSQVNQAQYEFLVGKGFTTGAIDDRWDAYFKSLTYVGSRMDKEYQYWQGANSN